MATQKHRNLTIEHLTITGTLNGEPVDGTPVPEAPAGEVSSTPVPEPLPALAPLPEKLTMAALAARQEAIIEALTAHGVLAPAEAPESAPQTVEVQTPVVKADSPAEPTPQAIAAGVVDGA